MSKAPSSITVRLLSRLADSVCAHPRWWILPQLFIFVFAVWVTISFLEFKMDRNDLVSADDEQHRIYMEYLEEFPLQTELVVVAESENRERNRQFVERLGAKLDAETNLFTDVFYKGDLKLLGDKALLFLPEDELRALKQRLEDYEPFIERFTQASNLVSLFNQVNRQIRQAQARTDEQNRSLLGALPAVQKIIDQATDSLGRPGVPPSPGLAALFGSDDKAEQQMYITLSEGRLYLVSARPASAEVARDSVVRLRELIAQTKLEVPGMNVAATGEKILEFDEMLQSQRDSTKASIIAIVLCGLIFVFGYRETGRPIKAVFCLLIGLGFTMGYTTLSVGHLNILTITFVPILVGLAIDFGVHLITRYEEELRNGSAEKEAMHVAIVQTGQGIFSGAFTTAGAFFAMGVTEFKGIREMGIICGGGMLVCLIPMMTLLPALLLRGRQNRLDSFRHVAPGFTNRLEKFCLNRPGLMIALGITITGFGLWQGSHVQFDYNLLNLQSKDLPAVALSKKLIDSNSRSVIFAAVQTDTMAEALELQKRFEELSTVAEVNFGGIDNMGRYLTEDQSIKLELVKEVQRAVSEVEFVPPDTNNVDIQLLSGVLYSLGGYMGSAAKAVGNDDPVLREQLLSVRRSTFDLTKTMLDDTTRRPQRKLALYQARLFSDIRDTFAAIRDQNALGPLRVGDLPSSLRDRFMGVTGKYLLHIYPRKNIWIRENQAEFIGELRLVTERVTGTPVEQYEYTSLLVRSYIEAALYALGAIVVLVGMHFRRLGMVVLSLVPVMIGTIWTAGIMNLLNLPVNPANIMVLPLVVGIGVTNGIHILNRFVEEGTPSLLTKSTGKAVVVSGMTTIAGFASLAMGKHQGIQSLGLVMSIGVGACMLAALTVMPALLMLKEPANPKRKKPSDDEAAITGQGGTEVKTS